MTEAQLQHQCVMWFNAHHRHKATLFHVPNARQQSKISGAVARGQGVLAGVPDLIVVQAGRCLMVELKTEDGRLSKAQVELHQVLAEQGTEVHVVRSLEVFVEVVEGWLEKPSQC